MKPQSSCVWMLLSILVICSLKINAAETVWRIEVVPSRNSKGKGAVLYAKKPQDNFYVILHNVSGKNQNLWRDWSPWGYNNLSIELILKNGKKVSLKRKPNKWDKAYPDAVLVPAGRSYVFPIHLAGKTWDGLDAVPATPFKMTVKFEIKETPEAKQKKVWMGSVASLTETFTLRK